jgi:hypothetical protein
LIGAIVRHGVPLVTTCGLASIDGSARHCTAVHDRHTRVVESGIITLNDNGTCSSLVAFSPESGEEMDREITKTYTQEGSIITIKRPEACVATGTVDGAPSQ